MSAGLLHTVAAHAATDTAENPDPAQKGSEIRVEGRVADNSQVSGALGNHSVLDTPLSVTTVSQADLADRGVTSLGNVFALDAAVNSQGSTSTIYSSHLAVRGLQLDETNGYKINGLPTYNFGIELPIQFFDSVELLKGATGFLYGFGAPGGIVNYVTAKPTTQTHASFDAGYRSDSIWTTHADLGGSTANGRFGYRLNYLHEEGDARDGSHVNNNAVALSLVAHLTDTLDWTADGIYQKRKTRNAVQGLGTAFYTDTVLPTAPSGSLHLPATNGSYFNTDYYMATTGLHWQAAPNWTVALDLSHSGNTRRFSFDFDYFTDRSGDVIDYVNDSRSRNLFESAQLLVQGHATTGPITHDLVFGASTQGELSYGNVNQVFTSIGTTNIYTGPALNYAQTEVPQEYKSASFIQTSLFASDRIGLTPRLSLQAGLRWTDYKQNGYATTGLNNASYSASPVTPTLALIYKPVSHATLYASYVESLEQGTTVASNYANHDALLSPIRSRQYEVGAKLDTDRWTASAALFAVRRGAGYANAANEYVQNGYALYEGIDASARFRATRDVSLGTSLLLLHADYSKSDASVQGNRVEGTPGVQAGGDVTYTVHAVPGLSVNGNVRYNGNQTVDSAAVLHIGDYTLLGLGAKYATKLADHTVTFRANLSNLTNRRYWTFIQSGFLYPGQSRAVSLSAQIAL
jgi:iron complex outermembrane receptor protein